MQNKIIKQRQLTSPWNCSRIQIFQYDTNISKLHA